MLIFYKNINNKKYHKFSKETVNDKKDINNSKKVPKINYIFLI